jgi:hypothetical protein
LNFKSHIIWVKRRGRIVAKKGRAGNRSGGRRPSFLGQVLFLIVLVVVAVLVIRQTLRKHPENVEGEVPVVKPSTDQEPVESGVEQKVNLWFGDDGGEFFIPVTRTLRVREGSDPHEIAVRELLRGPISDSMYGAFPEGTDLNGFRVENGTAFVDFSAQLMSYGGGTAGESALVKTLVLTLAEFEDVQRIQILVDGESREFLPEGYTIDQPISREDLSTDIGVPGPDDYSIFTIFKNDRGYLFPDFQIAKKKKNIHYTAFRRQLGSRVTGGGISLVIPDSFDLLNAERNGDVVNVELGYEEPEDVLTDINPPEFMKACSLVACQFDKSLKLRLLVNGRPISEYPGFETFTDPVPRPDEINAEGR